MRRFNTIQAIIIGAAMSLPVWVLAFFLASRALDE